MKDDKTQHSECVWCAEPLIYIYLWCKDPCILYEGLHFTDEENEAQSFHLVQQHQLLVYGEAGTWIPSDDCDLITKLRILTTGLYHLLELESRSLVAN